MSQSPADDATSAVERSTDTRVYTGPDHEEITADENTTDADHSAGRTADSAPARQNPIGRLAGTTEPRPITDHPLRSELHAISLQTDNPTFDGREAMLTIDQLREDYQTILAERGPWTVFTVDVHGHEADLYVWNEGLGWGLLFPNAAGGMDREAVVLLDTFVDAVGAGLDALHDG